MNRRGVSAVLVVAIGLGLTDEARAFASKELGFVHDTHNKLTTRALANAATSDFPDLGQFQSVIISGASTEGIGHAGSHTSPDGTIVWWFGNDSLWRTDLIAQYKAGSFSQAYKELGFMVHLAEDIQVPAHQSVTFHGLNFGYSLSPAVDPDGSGKQSPPSADYIQPVVGHADNFESFVSDEYDSGGVVDDLNDGANVFNSYPDPSNLNCTWQFWLNHSQASAPQGVVFWGDYGQGNSTTCGAASFGKRKDWFGNALLGNQVEIAQTQLFAARSNTESLLQSISKILPPLLKNMQTSTQFPGPSSPATLTFHAMDNRSATLTFTAKILNTDGSDTGKKAFDGTSLSLQAGTALPFEGDQSLSWNGKPTDGSTLAGGQYQLCGVVTDGDGNSYPGPSDQASDTCVNFTVDKTPPVISLLDQNSEPITDTTAEGNLIARDDTLSISANDTVNGVQGSGIASITVTGPGSYSKTFTESGGQTAVEQLTGIPNGDNYVVTVVDQAGNQTVTLFNMKAVGPRVTFSGAFDSTGIQYDFDSFHGQTGLYAASPADHFKFALDARNGSPVVSFELHFNGTPTVPAQTWDQAWDPGVQDGE